MHPVDPSLFTDGSTFINPFGLVFTLLMGVLTVVLPRRFAVIPVIVLTCYMTMGMRLVVGGLNFTMIRVLLVFAWARLLLRGELRSIKLNTLDKTIIACEISGFVAYLLLWQTTNALQYKLGAAYNSLGTYFFFRFLLRDKEDVVRALRFFSVLILPLAACMLLEKTTGRDPFAVFGGVPAITTVRDGALRCEGPFAHPILAGTFGATLMPLFVGLWQYQERKRMFAALAIAAAAVITVTSASSGPLLTFLSGILALCLWPFRHNMRAIRWGMVTGLVGLQMVMKAPVWFLLARVDVVSGSTGYHRAYLIDRAIANLSDWWLITMFLFIAIIVFSFKAIGRTVRTADGHEPEKDVRFIWAMGAALFAHTATFMSVSYFDQNFVNWSLLLAMIATCAGSSLLISRRSFFENLRLQSSGDASFLPYPNFAPVDSGSPSKHNSRFGATTNPCLNISPRHRLF